MLVAETFDCVNSESTDPGQFLVGYLAEQFHMLGTQAPRFSNQLNAATNSLNLNGSKAATQFFRKFIVRHGSQEFEFGRFPKAPLRARLEWRNFQGFPLLRNIPV